jgi:hypothetical protein
MKSGAWAISSKIKVYNHIYKPLPNCFSLIKTLTESGLMVFT